MKKYLIVLSLVLASILGAIIQLSIIDAFVSQLLIVPFFVVGIGIISAYFLKNVLFAPLITFFLTIIYNFVGYIHYYPGADIKSSYLFACSITFPSISFVIALLIFWNFRSFRREML
jgi:hypothetical protein